MGQEQHGESIEDGITLNDFIDRLDLPEGANWEDVARAMWNNKEAWEAGKNRTYDQAREDAKQQMQFEPSPDVPDEEREAA